jgi:hypothetical protein
MDTGMYFEMTMRLLFGDKTAYHIADSEMNPARRRVWLQRTVRKFMLLVDNLDTTPSHKSRMMTDLETIANSLKGVREPSWTLVYGLLHLCMHVLGFDSEFGVTCHTLAYWQTPAQHQHTRPRPAEGLIMQNLSDRQDVISLRRAIVADLNSKGLDDFKIALVLHTSEYEVKNLRSTLAPQRTGTRGARPGR